MKWFKKKQRPSKSLLIIYFVTFISILSDLSVLVHFNLFAIWTVRKYVSMVQMKVTTGTMGRQNQDNSLKGNGFACGDHRQLISRYLS